MSECPHGDIKRYGPDGKLIEVIPIDVAMNRSYKEFNKPKPFGAQRKKRKKTEEDEYSE